MIHQHHWMARPRHCHYYRTVKLLNQAGARPNESNYAGIVRYDWEEAQRLANDEPRRLEAKARWKHFDGTLMSSEQTIHTQLHAAHTKRIESTKMERQILHTEFPDDWDDTIVTFTTDQDGHVIPPGDGYMLLVYLSDRISTNSAQQFHPKD